MNWLIEEKLPTNIIVRCSIDYWNKITEIKHPIMKNKLEDVKLTIKESDEIRESKNVVNAILIYKKINSNRICVVAKLRNDDALIVTTYITDKIKEGVITWKK